MAATSTTRQLRLKSASALRSIFGDRSRASIARRPRWQQRQSSWTMLIPVILSGGSGTRLWPLSRELYPKQLLPLVGKRTMLQETAARLERPAGPRGARSSSATRAIASWSPSRCASTASTAAGDHPRARRAQHGAGRRGRRARRARSKRAGRKGGNDADPVLLVLPADHVIRDVAGVPGGRASRAARRPRRASSSRSASCPIARKRVTATSGAPAATARRTPSQQFVEKPDAATAATYVASGEYYWNSGMFMFRARAYLAELRAPCAGDARGLRGRRRGREARSRLHAPAGGRVRRLPERLDRLRGDGEDASRRWSCRSMPAGATSAPGRRCRTHCRRDEQGNVMTGDVLVEDTTRLLPAFDQPPDRRRRASRITSSSRPRMRCWSRRATACRTSRHW